ncbi:MAG TPA: sigma 54-interacting transcriptional regulator [Polyangiaceae bacterium]|jgi:transcriptional regulator with GAF, ATPase, and Fis domain
MPRDGPGYQSTHPKAPASGWTTPEQVLTLVHPPELAGQSIPLSLNLTLGRSPEADVASIFHRTMSRRHAQLRSGLGGVLCLSDLGSKNGSKVNGKGANMPVPFGGQAVIRLGDVLGVVDEPTDRRFGDDPVLPGASARMARAREQIERAAADPSPVLILGETGTGKERLAREVHERSGRSGPYLTLNVAELSPQLIESELFGHERGAFTGATTSKVGLFAAAHGGTLFLDEIGELSLELQPKLLRVLQEGELRPLGGVQARRIDVRIVAATNRNLPELVETDAFRRDLYARLALWEVRLPPLRERRQDILPWIDALLSAWNRQRGTRVELGFLPDAAERVLLGSWPDNLRGLDRLVHRLASLELQRPVSERALFDAMPELFPGSVRPDAPDGSVPPGGAASNSAAGGSTLPPRDEPLAARRPSREELLAVYEATGHSVRATSKHFGKDRRQIYRWLEGFGIPRGRDED